MGLCKVYMSTPISPPLTSNVIKALVFDVLLILEWSILNIDFEEQRLGKFVNAVNLKRWIVVVLVYVKPEVQAISYRTLGDNPNI